MDLIPTGIGHRSIATNVSMSYYSIMLNRVLLSLSAESKAGTPIFKWILGLGVLGLWDYVSAIAHLSPRDGDTRYQSRSLQQVHQWEQQLLLSWITVPAKAPPESLLCQVHAVLSVNC